MNNTIIVPVIPERVAEFLQAETVASDRVEAKLCWQRFEKWLPGLNERHAWTRNKFYGELRALGYWIKPGTGNHLMIHGLTLKASNECPD